MMIRFGDITKLPHASFGSSASSILIPSCDFIFHTYLLIPTVGKQFRRIQKSSTQRVLFCLSYIQFLFHNPLNIYSASTPQSIDRLSFVRKTLLALPLNCDAFFTL